MVPFAGVPFLGFHILSHSQKYLLHQGSLKSMAWTGGKVASKSPSSITFEQLNTHELIYAYSKKVSFKGTVVRSPKLTLLNSGLDRHWCRVRLWTSGFKILDADKNHLQVAFG